MSLEQSADRWDRDPCRELLLRRRQLVEVLGYTARRVMDAEAKQLGEHIVADPRICHGKPTFRGTRILVATVLEQLADGWSVERILQSWRGQITAEAIKEAVILARDSFIEHHAASAAA